MANQDLSKALKQVLADSYTLYLKTQNYHWNVEGPHFKSLHLLFEEQYTDLATAIDEIAELIRTLGDKAPGNFNTYKEATKIQDGNENATGSEMLKELCEDQNIIISSLEEAVEIAQNAKDDTTADAMIQRISVHRKNKWMLKSSC